MPTIRLLNDSFRLPIERTVSQYIGRAWHIKDAKDMAEFASHPAAILSDGLYAVFAKFSEAADGFAQLETEVASLRLLAERSGVLTPTAIANIAVDDGYIMLLAAVQAVERTPYYWQQTGRTLGRIHRIKGTQFGLETHGYFGTLYQDNKPTNDWPTFYVERRMQPYLKLAVDSRNIPPVITKQVERLIARLPELCGPDIIPALLHGDAQQNNFISTECGTMVIDPAPYYGHPEIDLACLDFFQPVPDDVFDGYREEMAIAPGFTERRDLWRIGAYLAVVSVTQEAEYLEKLKAAVQKYL